MDDATELPLTRLDLKVRLESCIMEVERRQKEIIGKKGTFNLAWITYEHVKNDLKKMQQSISYAEVREDKNI